MSCVCEMAGSLFILSRLLFLWLCFSIGFSTIAYAQSNVVEGTVHINGTTPVAQTDEDFICATMDWWPPDKCDYGTCSWGTSSLLNLDLSNKILLNAVKEFSPLKIRLGGTLQDKVVYQNVGDKQPCMEFYKSGNELLGFSQGCLPMSRWDELNTFFRNARVEVIFGLNALNGRIIKDDRSAIGPWNSSNAESLIRYTINKGYTIHGWELGNELSGSGIGAHISPDQYAYDIISLRNMVQHLYQGFDVKPIVLGPGGFFDADWFTKFVHSSQNSLQVVTHHIYNLGSGEDDYLPEKILDPNYLDGEAQTFRSLESILKASGTSTVAWVGESGGAYNSGRNHVSNAFVFSFWYLDQLGMSASFDTKTYCRQTLIGGNYGLLDTATFVPNPDYYSALLWHRLMGRKVLSTSFSGTKKLRTYSHCSKLSKGITVLLINLDGNTTVQVGVSVSDTIKNIVEIKRETHNQRTQFSRMPRYRKYRETTREEYHLTAEYGDLHSRTMLLNGKALTVNSSGTIPSLVPVHVNFLEPVTVAPFSIVFVDFPSIQVPACR